MPIDPEFQPLLEMFGQMPPFSDEGLPLLRGAAFPPAPPIDLARVEDLTIDGAAGPIGARLYQADGAAGQAGIVFYHGGGFVIGGLESHDGFCQRLCAAIGCTVLSVDYRLAPENRFPAAADDAFAALGWFVANAARYGVDPERVLVAGDSAGGNLAASTALRCRDQAGPTLRGQILICPVVEFYRSDRPSYVACAEGPFLTAGDMAYCTGAYLRSPEDALDPYAAPIQAPSLGGLAPALVLTAEFDPLRDEGEAYGARIQADGGRAQVSRYDGAIHDFVLMLGTGAAERGLAEIAAWARLRLGL